MALSFAHNILLFPVGIRQEGMSGPIAQCTDGRLVLLSPGRRKSRSCSQVSVSKSEPVEMKLSAIALCPDDVYLSIQRPASQIECATLYIQKKNTSPRFGFWGLVCYLSHPLEVFIWPPRSVLLPFTAAKPLVSSRGQQMMGPSKFGTRFMVQIIIVVC